MKIKAGITTLLIMMVIISVIADSSSSEEKKEKKRLKHLKKMHKDRIKYEKLLQKGKKFADRPYEIDVGSNKIVHLIKPGVTRPLFDRPPSQKVKEVFIELDQNTKPAHGGLIHIQKHHIGQEQHGHHYDHFGQHGHQYDPIGQHGHHGQYDKMIVTSKVSQPYVPGGIIRPSKWTTNGMKTNDMSTVVLVKHDEPIGKQQQQIVGQWGKQGQLGHILGQNGGHGNIVEILEINKIPTDGIEGSHSGGHGIHKVGGNTMGFIKIHKTSSGKPGDASSIYKTIGGVHHHVVSGGEGGKQWELLKLQPHQEIKQIYYQNGKRV